MTKSDTGLLEERRLPPALPAGDAAGSVHAPRASGTRRITVQNALCILCALTALGVLLLAAVAKLDEIRMRGFLRYITEDLLTVSAGGGTLGQRMSAAVFGTAEVGSPDLRGADIDAALPAPMTLPRIYYIPKEEIAKEIYTEREQLERKIFALYAFDTTKVPAGKYAILPTDLSASDALELKNSTSFDIDMHEVAAAAKTLPAETVTAEPLVLIVHTHGTEAFSEEGSVCYGDGYNEPRSTDTAKNVVAVGRVLCEALNAAGIPALQCEVMHDRESYIAAYERSAETVAQYLEKYPSICYVLDVHRDSLIRGDRTKLRPVTLYNGKPCAQLMMLVGSDEKGAGSYDWMGNLTLAEAVQQHLCADTLGVARPLCLRGASYNQQLAARGLLVEIGSCGNSLSETENAARAFAAAFIKVLRGE